MLVAAMRVGPRDGAAALGEDGRLVSVCAQERVTRVRGGPNPGCVPNEALETLLQRAARRRTDIERLDWIGEGCGAAARERTFLDDHFAHACTAYFTSPHATAAILICDRDAPHVSAWTGRGGRVERVEIDWSGPGFADAFASLATAMGFDGEVAEQRFEALARLQPDARDPELESLIRSDGRTLAVAPELTGTIAKRLADRPYDDQRRGAIAAALQARIGDLVLELLRSSRGQLDGDVLCVGGSLFYHSAINTRLRLAGVFRDVFVPIDPGNTGVVAGAVLHALGASPSPASPFLGPAYSAEESKAVLDNCKLQYSWESEGECIAAAVDALVQGHLVAWFDGAMEWGPRALGARSILANPRSPYVLENLNRFLKRREPWRGYALSGLRDAVHTHFDGPAAAPFMECEYRPRDREHFRHVLPSPTAALRVHTVDERGLPRFTRLLEAVGLATGLPFLVNTSFNSFHEPSVCSPRDAVRVFYGSGLDLLVLDHFVLRK